MAVETQQETQMILKILMDLDVDLMDGGSEEGFLDALKEGHAKLVVVKQDETPRAKILLKKILELREKRKAADPTFKTISKDKFLNRKAPSNQKVSPQKLLPAASEEG